MTVRYTLDKEDLTRFTQRLFRIAPSALRRPLIQTAVLGGIIILIFGFNLIKIKNLNSQYFDAVIGMYAVALFAILILSFFVYTAVLKYTLKKMNLNPKSGVLGEQTVSITDEAFTVRDANSTIAYEWSELYAFKMYKEYAYLFVAKGRAHIIPLDKLGEEKDAFLSALRSRLSEATHLRKL